MSVLEEAVVHRDHGPALYSCWSRVPAPKAMIGILHGYADYGARYAHVMGALAERGIASLAIDMRGHGRAEGPRGNCERFPDYLDDVKELDRLMVAKNETSAPMFLFGHSFGGLVATHRMLSADGASSLYRGLLLSGPFFGLALQVPAVKRALGRVASKIAPNLGLPAGIAGANLTHDSARAKAYDEDPLVFKLARARWFRETEKAREEAIARAKEIQAPCRIVFGGADPVASLASAKEFFARLGSKDKEFHEEPGLFHEVLNEPEWPRLTSEIADWVLARAG